VIGFLRLIGVMNAAVWLGGAVFFTVSAAPAAYSAEMEAALRHPGNFPYFSNAIEQALLPYYFRFLIVCGVIALLHSLAEWLYLGRPVRKFSFGLLATLIALALLGANGIQPRLRTLHQTRYFGAPPAAREAAAKSFRGWHIALSIFNVSIIGGLAVYVWRVATPPDSTRFISSVKFRD
jgi:hypothetical protein